MTRVLTIAGRELRSWFASPLAFVVMAVFLFLTGLFFDLSVRDYARMSLVAAQDPVLAEQMDLHSAVIRPLYQSFAFFMLLVIPLVSMRLLAEEMKQGTIELLLTAPVRTSELVLGKFLGALGFLTVLLAFTAQYPLFLWVSGSAPPAAAFWSAFLGTWLVGAAVLSVGLMTSSLTENQVISAVACLVISIFFWVIGFAEMLVGEEAGRLLRAISLMENVEDLSKGVVDTACLVFFATFIAFNLFLTQRSLESRRWR